jgi:RNA polymerase sigma-70 factor (ECF subfamily)
VSQQGGALEPTAVAAGEACVVAALRRGEEAAFVRLVDNLSPAMLRVAQTYVPSRTVAEEVVQETWTAVLEGLDRFQQRSSLRTWVFSILANIAKTRGVRERRTVPFSSAFPEETGPTVDPGRFLPDDDPEWPHHWATPPRRWEQPESALLSSEIRTRLAAAMQGLPPRQRAVVSLRDVHGYGTDEVCRLMDISPANQRVLLHRARGRMRHVLAEYLAGERA